jgi:hypothetical protein
MAFVVMGQCVRFWDWVRFADSVFIAEGGSKLASFRTAAPGFSGLQEVTFEIGFVPSHWFETAVAAPAGRESSSRSIMNLGNIPLHAV